MKSHFNSAILLNNEGVRLLEAGKYDEARVVFKKATDTMTMAANSKKQRKGRRKRNRKQENRMSNFIWSDLPKHMPVTECTNPDIRSSFFYQRALFISPTAYAIKANWMDHDCVEESATMVYNLALSYHLSGIVGNVSEMMKKAKTLYQIAAAIRETTMKQDELDVFRMVILNNLGQIYHEETDYGTAKSCFNQLAAQLAALQSHDLLHWVSKEDCDGFVLNAMLEAPDLAAAA